MRLESSLSRRFSSVVSPSMPWAGDLVEQGVELGLVAVGGVGGGWGSEAARGRRRLGGAAHGPADHLAAAASGGVSGDAAAAAATPSRASGILGIHGRLAARPMLRAVSAGGGDA